MSIKKARIVIEDGSTSAFLTTFTNAIYQRRQIAFDGRQWFVQANNKAPFKPVGESEVPPEVKERMETFLNERRQEQQLLLLPTVMIITEKDDNLNAGAFAECLDRNSSKPPSSNLPNV
jgi:hypothetical protein